jgi:predicted transcriptional regulator
MEEIKRKRGRPRKNVEVPKEVKEIIEEVQEKSQEKLPEPI